MITNTQNHCNYTEEKMRVYKFLEKMLEKEKWCKETMKKHFNKQLEITAAEEKDFKKSDSCHICGNKYEP